MLDHLLSVNVKAIFMASGHYLAPEKDNGAIVNISSMGGAGLAQGRGGLCHLEDGASKD